MSATHELGLGMAYERWAVGRALLEWCPDPPRTALEGPLDGVAGMPGLHLLPLARRGTAVTVVVPDEAAAARVRETYARRGLADRLEALVAGEAPSRRFELVLSFNALPLAADWRAYLADLGERAAARLIVSVTNRFSYGTWLRRGLRLAEAPARRREPELFEHESTDPHALAPELEKLGRIGGERFLDCPWWPDLFVPAGKTLWEATFGRVTGAPRAARFVHDATTYPFGEEGCPEELARALRRHPVFDGGSAWLGRLFGHHRAWLVDPRR